MGNEDFEVNVSSTTAHVPYNPPEEKPKEKENYKEPEPSDPYKVEFSGYSIKNLPMSDLDKEK